MDKSIPRLLVRRRVGSTAMTSTVNDVSRDAGCARDRSREHDSEHASRHGNDVVRTSDRSAGHALGLAALWFTRCGPGRAGRCPI